MTFDNTKCSVLTQEALEKAKEAIAKGPSKEWIEHQQFIARAVMFYSWVIDQDDAPDDIKQYALIAMYHQILPPRIAKMFDVWREKYIETQAMGSDAPANN